MWEVLSRCSDDTLLFPSDFTLESNNETLILLGDSFFSLSISKMFFYSSNSRGSTIFYMLPDFKYFDPKSIICMVLSLFIKFYSKSLQKSWWFVGTQFLFLDYFSLSRRLYSRPAAKLSWTFRFRVASSILSWDCIFLILFKI